MFCLHDFFPFFFRCLIYFHTVAPIPSDPSAVPPAPKPLRAPFHRPEGATPEQDAYVPPPSIFVGHPVLDEKDSDLSELQRKQKEQREALERALQGSAKDNLFSTPRRDTLGGADVFRSTSILAPDSAVSTSAISLHGASPMANSAQSGDKGPSADGSLDQFRRPLSLLASFSFSYFRFDRADKITAPPTSARLGGRAPPARFDPPAPAPRLPEDASLLRNEREAKDVLSNEADPMAKVHSLGGLSAVQLQQEKNLGRPTRGSDTLPPLHPLDPSGLPRPFRRASDDVAGVSSLEHLYQTQRPSGIGVSAGTSVADSMDSATPTGPSSRPTSAPKPGLPKRVSFREPGAGARSPDMLSVI